MFYEFQHFGISESFSKEYNENFNFPMHLHQSFEFVTVLSGEMVITVDKTEYTLTQGEALLIFPNQLHSFLSKGSEHLLCIFSPQLVSAFNSYSLDKVPVSNKFVPDSYIISRLSDIDNDSKIFEKKALLYTICTEFDKTADYTKIDARRENSLFYKIFSFVENNYKDDCLLSDLEKECGLSYSYLSRYFKNTIGLSFNEYVNQYRISKACYMLTNSDVTILECAYESGYKSLRSFNRNFKLYTEVSPYQYRKNAV